MAKSAYPFASHCLGTQNSFYGLHSEALYCLLATHLGVSTDQQRSDHRCGPVYSHIGYFIGILDLMPYPRICVQYIPRTIVKGAPPRGLDLRGKAEKASTPAVIRENEEAHHPTLMRVKPGPTISNPSINMDRLLGRNLPPAATPGFQGDPRTGSAFPMVLSTPDPGSSPTVAWARETSWRSS